MKAKYLSKDDLDQKAEEILLKFNCEILKIPTQTNIENMIESFLKLEVDYQILSKDKTVLGLTTFNTGNLVVYDESNQEKKIKVKEGTVIIDNLLIEENNYEPRYRFTLSHEAGHWILHKELMQYDENQCSIFDAEQAEGKVIKCLNRNVGNMLYNKTDADWLEWQADYLGASLLMPKKTFESATFMIFHNLLRIYKPYIYVDSQKCNIENYKILRDKLKEIFNVSNKAIEIRLKNLNLLRTIENFEQLEI